MYSPNQDGFSLIEIMVTVVLIAMIISGALGTQREGLRLGKFGETLTTDTATAASLGESLRLYAGEIPRLPLPLTVHPSGDAATATAVTTALRRLLQNDRHPELPHWITIHCHSGPPEVCQACREAEDQPPLCSAPVML